MANAFEGTVDREYLCEWPPTVQVKTQNDSEISKKRKLADKDNDTDEKYVEAKKDVLGCSHEFPWARPALAKWWKKRLQITKKQDMSLFPKSNNPNTLLKYLASLPEGKEFLKQQVCVLQKETALHPRCAALHLALASYYDILKDVNAAFHSLKIATKLDPFDKEIAWLHLKVQRHKDLNDQRRCLEESVSISKLGECQMPRPVEVKRHHYSLLDTKEFLFQYCVSKTPVIITGMVEHMTTVRWDMQHVKEVVGDKSVFLKRMVKESTEWAKLEPACRMTVADFIDSLHSVPELLYLFDWSLPTNAPELVKELHIPKYFAGDFLQRTTPGSLYKDSWPSLFIAPAGLHSDLHVDAFGSNFWMALFEGRKRWTFFSAEDVPLLYPRYEDSLDLVFDVDLSSPDFDAHPLLCRTTPKQCTLEPGELLFVPHGCPHMVENLEDSLAISANFVDLSNFHVVLEELKGSALLDPRAEDLLSQMRKDSFPTKMFSQENDMPWYKFKTWPRLNYEDYDIDIKDMQRWNQQLQDSDRD